MKQELIDKNHLFDNQSNDIIIAVTYRGYYKEDKVDFNYSYGINPNPQIVEFENVDYFDSLNDGLKRVKELSKIKKYHKVEIYQRNIDNSGIQLG